MLRSLSSPDRLEILDVLGRGPAKVHELSAALGVSQPTTSGHLAALRGAGLVEAARSGRDVWYHLADPEIVAVCEVARQVVTRRLTRLGAMAVAARGNGGALHDRASPRIGTVAGHARRTTRRTKELTHG